MPLRDQRLPFMFEVWDQTGPVKTYVLPINPEEYGLAWTPRATVTQTKAGAWQDNFGMGLPRVTIKGTFGYLGTLPGGGGQSIGGVQLCGQELFKELEKTFLDFYARFGGEDPDMLADLRFYAYTDEFYWAVQLDSFHLLRSVQRRHVYTYQIQLTGLRPLDGVEKKEGETLEDPTQFAGVQYFDDFDSPQVEALSWWEEALVGYRWVSAEISETINDLAVARSKLTTIQQAVRAFRENVSAFIEAPFELVNETIDTVDVILDTVNSLAGIPDEFIGLMRETKRTLLGYKLQRPRFREPPDPTQVLLTGLPVEILTTSLPRTGAGVAMNDPDTTTFAPGIEEGSDRPTAEVTANAGDSLQTLAQKYLGDAREWKRLAFLNDLAYPFELSAGQRVKIPGLSATGTLALLSTEAASDTAWEARAYGTDEGLSNKAQDATPTGSPWTQAGLSNLAMQLQHRLNTARGELAELGHPTYGSILPSLIGKVSTDYWMERAKVEAKSCLLEDPRVQSVERVTFTEANGNIFIEGDVVPKNRTSSEHVRLLVA